LDEDIAPHINKQKTACFLFYDRVLSNRKKHDPFFYFLVAQDNESPKIVTKEQATLYDWEVDNWYPKTFQEKVDKILVALAKKSKVEGEPIDFSTEEMILLLFLDIDFKDTHYGTLLQTPQCKFYKDYFEENKLLKFTTKPVQAGQKVDNPYLITIQPTAYKIIYELQKNQTNNKKAFIACSFADEHKYILGALKTAVGQSGYLPNPICDKPHNNWIMTEVLFEVKDSKFVIADLTGHRAGVYYEAGFGEALGKQVILTCQEADFGNIHFDLKQKFVIKYKDADELIEKLKAQIKGTVGAVATIGRIV